jgi:hypothetical protein
MSEITVGIVMLGFIISIILIFLALIVNQSALVGKTTAESVLEFSNLIFKNARAEILEYYWKGTINQSDLRSNMLNMSLERKSSIVLYNYNQTENIIYIHYNDGYTEYDEIMRGP